MNFPKLVAGLLASMLLVFSLGCGGHGGGVVEPEEVTDADAAAYEAEQREYAEAMANQASNNE